MAARTSPSPISPAASGAATTSRFFTHWRGRTARTSAQATPCSGVAWAPTVPSVAIDVDPPTRARRPILRRVPDHDPLRGKQVVFLSWRDTRNPEGGGAERYLETIAAGLVERGARVTIFCAAHAAAPPEEMVSGIRFVRRGSKLSVYLEGMRALRRGDLGDPDVVVDVQNGLPFFSRLVTRKPVVVLVHHVHREQWPVVYPGLTGTRRLVHRAPAGAAALPPQPVRRRLAGHPQRAPDAGRARTARRGGAQRHRPRGARRGRQVRRRRWSRPSAGWCRTSRSSTPSTPSSRCARRTRGCGCTSSAAAGGRRGCTSTRGSGTPATRSSSRARSTRPASTRSTSGPGCWRCPRSRRAGGWWSARPACTAPRRWPTARRAAPRSRSCTALRGAGRRPGGVHDGDRGPAGRPRAAGEAGPRAPG